MPILPQNRKRYPRNWKEIRAAILKRANNRCEWCGLENGVFGIRRKGEFEELSGMALEVASLDGERITRIVLTIAHLNHTPEDNRPENLAALCQKCHLGYDMHIHVRNRARSRLAKLEARGQINFLREPSEETCAARPSRSGR